MTLNSPAFLLAATIALAATGVQSQTLSKMIADTGMSPDDFTMMEAAARGLYAERAPRAGASADWSNPDSGTHGHVVLSAVDGDCVTIRHQVNVKGAAEARKLSARRCRDDQGKWLLQP